MKDELLPPTKQEIIEELDMMVSNLSSLPSHVKTTPITHYDFEAALWLIVQLFKEKQVE